MFSAILILVVGLLCALVHRVTDRFGRASSSVIAIVVFGDLGCSPRMRNHARSCASWLKCNESPKRVLLIGYRGTSIPEDLRMNPYITICQFPKPAAAYDNSKGLKRKAVACFRVAVNCVRVWWILATTPRLCCVVLQSPPSTPYSILLRVLTWIRAARLIIDIHNYGFTIANQTQALSAISGIIRKFELIGLALADELMAVSKSMQSDILQNIGRAPVVVYDRPPQHFRKPASEERQAMLIKYLGGTAGQRFKVITSCSYTEDDNLSILFDAVKMYCHAADTERLPGLQVTLTGTGPLECVITKEIEALKECVAEKAQISKCFTTADDYPLFLGSHDLGVVIHESTSGLDLPMKLVDMTAVELTAVAYDYAALHEVLEPSKMFRTVDELACRLIDAARTWASEGTAPMPQAKDSESWDIQWDRLVAPIMC